MSKSYMEEYQRWLDSPALSEEEWKELNSIAGDEKEIENRFYAPLEFGTAGLRGTMKLGLHNMNIHIIRHATQAFANVILADGEDADEPRHSHRARLPSQRRGVFQGGGLRHGGKRHTRPLLRRAAPDARAELRRAALRHGCRPQHHRKPQPQGIQRLQGLLVRRRAAPASQGRSHRKADGSDRHLHGLQDL